MPVSPGTPEERKALLYRFNAALWPKQRFVDAQWRMALQRSPQSGLPLSEVGLSDLRSCLRELSPVDSQAGSEGPFIPTTAIVLGEGSLFEDDQGNPVKVIEISSDYQHVRLLAAGDGNSQIESRLQMDEESRALIEKIINEVR